MGDRFACQWLPDGKCQINRLGEGSAMGTIRAIVQDRGLITKNR
jgi:hypothetical protein